jgi:hypothetical protein
LDWRCRVRGFSPLLPLAAVYDRLRRREFHSRS